MTDTKIVPKFSTNKEAAAFYKNKLAKPDQKNPPGKVKKTKMKMTKQKREELAGVVDRAREICRIAAEAKKGSFVSVSTDEKGKVTTTNVAAPATLEAGMAREYMKNALGDRPFTAILTQQFAVQTSSANTALSTSLAADLTATNEWSSFAALFDEVRCLNYKARTIVAFGGSGSGSPSTIPVFGMATQFTTTVSLASIMVATHHVGPVPIGIPTGYATSITQGLGAQPVTHYGYFEVQSGRMPAGAVGPATSSTNAPIQGDWLATTATTGQGIVGYINQITEALGANQIATTRTFGYYLVEFRLRQ